MDEENNSMRPDDMQSQMQQGKDIATKGANQASKFAKNLLAKDKENKKKKIKSAKTLGEKAGEVAGRGPKMAGRAMQATGKGMKAAGKATMATGIGVQAAGKGIDAAGKGIQAVGDALTATGIGAAVGAPLKAIGTGVSAAGKGVDKAGQGIKKAGHKINKVGKKIDKQGKKLVKQGNKIEDSVKNGIAGGKIPKIPNMPNNVKTPNKGKLIRDALSKLLKRKVTRYVIMGSAPIIGMILIYFIIIGSMVDRGTARDGDNSNVPYVVSSTVMSNITIVSDGSGGYKYAFTDSEGNEVSLDEAIENALETLKSNDCNALSELGSTDEIRKETLKKLILAEIKTQYPDLSNSGLAAGTSFTPSTSTADVGQIVNNMTLEEKIYQMLMVGVQLNNGQDYSDSLAGGFILHGGSDYDANLNAIGSSSKIKPFIATDDEGGQIVRAAVGYPSAKSYGDSQDYDKLYSDEVEKSELLLQKGINVNLGPDADVSSSGTMYNSERSYSSNADITKQCVKKVIEARKATDVNGVFISSSLKHYPGYGSNGTNSDLGKVVDNRTVAQINNDIKVFEEGINAGAESVMVSNITYTNLDSQNPASLSPTIVGRLRNSFSGVIMTDDIDAAATSSVSDRYKKAIIAGNDIVILGVGNLQTAYNQILSAVNNGEISEERINESVNRILQMKKNAGLLRNVTTTNSNTISGGNQAFLENAKIIKKKVADEGYTYGHTDPRTTKLINCATFVNWALLETGFDVERSGWIPTYAYQTGEICESLGFQKVYEGKTLSVEEAGLQPGDIVIEGDQYILDENHISHTQIYVGKDENGNNVWYNTGGNGKIRLQPGEDINSNPYASDHYIVAAFRISGGTASSSLSSTSSTSDMQGGIKFQRKDSNGSVQQLKYIDETTFNQLVISGSDDCMKYYTLKKTTSGTSNSYGGSDILSDWIASWENGGLFLYKKGQGSYDDWGVEGYITEDGQSYICRTDVGTGNGTLNYGFGIMVNQNGRPNNVEYFQKYGIDITDSQYLQESVSILPVELVDNVKKDILADKVKHISEVMDGYGITLNNEELHALCGIAYQYGDAGANLDSFAQLYKQYGNSEELRQKYCSAGGTQFFVSVPGGTNSEGIDRAAANWGLFHDGIYYAGSGGTLDKGRYGTSSNNSSSGTSSNIDNGDFSGSDHQQIAWNFFKSMGLSDVATAAIVGNFMQESSSNIDPTADNGSHRGIGQWDYSDRYAKLKSYAASINKSPDDFETQLKFAWLETSPTADHTYATLQWSQERYNEFIAINDAREAAKYFADYWERCPGQAITQRQDNAEEVLGKFAGTQGNGGAAVTSLDNFLFIGDSRYSTTASQISVLGANIKNEGVGSARVDEWKKVAENGGTGTVQKKSVDITGEYSGISVQLGANSVYNNVANATSDMKAFLEKLKALHPNTPIYVNSCMQVNSEATSSGYTWDVPTMRDCINEFNSDISNYCGQIDNLYYVDISEGLNDADGYIKAEYTDDGLHCNGSGAGVFAENIKTAILNSGASGTSKENSSDATGSTYTLVVANKKSTTTSVTYTYDYSYTTNISTGSGTTSKGTQVTSTPAPTSGGSNTVYSYSSATADYQTALKNYTLYFDFLWAILVDTSGDLKFISSWADLGANSTVLITVYSDSNTSTTSSSQATGTESRYSYNPDNKVASQDVYNVTQTTTVTTTTITSKPAITDADTWLLKYENNANTYSEYQSKSQEKITEKVDENSSQDNIITILQSSKQRLKTLTREKYLVDRMIEDNKKVSFMSDIYEYILNIANGKDVDQNKTKLRNTLDTSLFDLSNSNAVTQKVLLYTSLNISDEDKELLYKFVEQTGANCSKEEKEYIASVILNRALSGKFGTSDVSKIINASYQFENYDSSKNDNITPSDETKEAVDNVISTGDKSGYAVYFGTPETAQKKKWDQSGGKKGFKSTQKGSVYNFYTTEESEKELKKLETTTTIGVGAGSLSSSDTAQKIVAWAEAQVGKSSFYNSHHGYEQVAKNYCAAFVECAYYEAGLEYYGGNAIDLPHPNKIEYNSDGTVNCSNIPVGAIIVSQGVPVDGVAYGHVCLYIGNGYIIEAGGSTVQKTPIDESFAGKGHNCAPFLGWGFATHDQEDARSKLVSSGGISGNFQQGWTSFGVKSAQVRSTGVEGIYKFGNKQYNVYAQGYNDVWGGKPYWDGTYGSDACGITSTAIILSGLGVNITPEGVNGDGLIQNGNTIPYQLKNELAKYGFSCSEPDYSKSKIIEHLKSGNPVFVHVSGSKIGNNSYKGHYVTLLGINEQGQIFLGDPAGGGNNSGYFDQNNILSGVNWCIYVYGK